MHESATHGCPVFTAPSAIVVVGDTPANMRKALDKVANELDEFEVQLGKVRQ